MTWAQCAQTRPGAARRAGRTRNGPAGAKWEGEHSGKRPRKAGKFREIPPVTSRKALAALIQSFPSTIAWYLPLETHSGTKGNSKVRPAISGIAVGTLVGGTAVGATVARTAGAASPEPAPSVEVVDPPQAAVIIREPRITTATNQRRWANWNRLLGTMFCFPSV